MSGLRGCLPLLAMGRAIGEAGKGTLHYTRRFRLRAINQACSRKVTSPVVDRADCI